MRRIRSLAGALLLASTSASAHTERQTHVLAIGPQFRFGDAGSRAPFAVPRNWNRPGSAATRTSDRDRAAKGWAVSSTDRAQDFALIGELGDNTARLSHCQHDEQAAVGDRIFDVTVNDRAILTGIDVRRAAGGAGRVIERRFAVEPSEGRVTVTFKPVRGEPIVSAVELVKGD